LTAKSNLNPTRSRQAHIHRMTFAAALEMLKPVFSGVFSDLRALLRLLELIIRFDPKTRRDLTQRLRALEADTYVAMILACEDLPELPLPAPREDHFGRIRQPRKTASARAPSAFTFHIPASAPRTENTLRERTKSFAGPTPGSVHRANLLLRISHLMHIVTQPEAAFAAFAKRLYRQTKDPILPEMAKPLTGTMPTMAREKAERQNSAVSRDDRFARTCLLAHRPVIPETAPPLSGTLFGMAREKFPDQSCAFSGLTTACGPPQA
jgi:hypothetical protein